MRRWLIVLTAAVALALIAGRWVSVVYADWHWFGALGALPVYRSRLMHEMAWRAGAASLAFGFAFLNLWALRRSIVSLVLPRRLGNLEIGEAVPSRVLLLAVLGTSAMLALLLSSPEGDWTTFALARNADRIGEMDPYLDRDLAFVMAWVPFEQDLYAWAGKVMVSVMVLMVALYALTPSLRIRARGIYVSSYCRRHLVTLASLGILLLAWRSRIDALTITSAVGEATNTFGPFEQKVGLPMQTWITALTALSAFIVFWGGWHGHVRLVALAGLVATVGGPVAQATLPRLTWRKYTETEVREQTRPFSATRRLFTRRAFGVDEIVLGQSSPPSLGDLATRVASWDPAAIAAAAGVAAPAAPVATALSWTVDGGAIRATVVSPSNANGGAWDASGFDPTVTDERGRLLPAVPRDAAHATRHSWPALLVHPGAAAPFVFADSGGHAPAPAFERALDRLALAWSLRAPGLLWEEPPELRPRIAYRRDVRERIHALAPFLTQGPTIVPMVRADSLYWVVELFTTARFYPLSDRLIFAGELRPYVHHAATAFVHAGTGQVTFSATASPDGIMRAWMRRFPWMFIAPAELPAGLAAGRTPAVDWAELQATALARTGVGTGALAARLAVATDNADADLISDSPTLFAEGGDVPRLAWSTALLDAAGAVTGIVIADASGTTRWHPVGSTQRWSDLLDQLQRSADSAGIGRQRRNARRGRVQAIPVGNSAVFIQTHYEWSSDAAPVATGVAANLAGTSRAAATLAEALGLPAGLRNPAGGAFRAAVEQLHRRMNEAIRRGDWAAFGVAFEALGELLRGAGR